MMINMKREWENVSLYYIILFFTAAAATTIVIVNDTHIFSVFCVVCWLSLDSTFIHKTFDVWLLWLLNVVNWMEYFDQRERESFEKMNRTPAHHNFIHIPSSSWSLSIQKKWMCCKWEYSWQIVCLLPPLKPPSNKETTQHNVTIILLYL